MMILNGHHIIVSFTTLQKGLIIILNPQIVPQSYYYSYIKHREMDTCFMDSAEKNGRKYHILLIGDSRMRNILEMIQTNLDRLKIFYDKKPQYNIYWESNNFNLKVSFLWYPILNDTYAQVIS